MHVQFNSMRFQLEWVTCGVYVRAITTTLRAPFLFISLSVACLPQECFWRWANERKIELQMKINSILINWHGRRKPRNKAGSIVVKISYMVVFVMCRKVCLCAYYACIKCWPFTQLYIIPSTSYIIQIKFYDDWNQVT